MIRQGDQLFIPVDLKPGTDGVQKRNLILAEGEGHHEHVLDKGTVIVGYDSPDQFLTPDQVHLILGSSRMPVLEPDAQIKGILLIQGGEATVFHRTKKGKPETDAPHGPVTLPEGAYLQIQQREHDGRGEIKAFD
jgi:hypothetical protein